MSNRPYKKSETGYKVPIPGTAAPPPEPRPTRADARSSNAYDRHVKYMNDYVMYYGRGKLPAAATTTTTYRTDSDILRDNFRFVREDDDAEVGSLSWEAKLAKKYYDKLFKEYALADMSRYKEGKVGLRWRTEKEVVAGKGQFICGNKACSAKDSLRSFEVHFAYRENGEKKETLVKLRVCPDCGYKLNYKKMKESKRARKELRRALEGEQSNEKDSGNGGSGGDSRGRHAGEKRPRDDDDSVAEGGKSDSAPVVSREDAADHWKQKPTLDRTKEDDLDDYFAELFP